VFFPGLALNVGQFTSGMVVGEDKWEQWTYLGFKCGRFAGFIKGRDDAVGVVLSGSTALLQ
jgi:hypothetical protein